MWLARSRKGALLILEEENHYRSFQLTVRENRSDVLGLRGSGMGVNYVVSIYVKKEAVGTSIWM